VTLLEKFTVQIKRRLPANYRELLAASHPVFGEARIRGESSGERQGGARIAGEATFDLVFMDVRPDREVMSLQGRLSIERMCQIVPVSRRGFYRSTAAVQRENNANNFNAMDISLPAVITVFLGEIYRAPRG
jgi:hypothetical protein